MSNTATTDFAKLLNRYFTVYLTSQRGCSAVTIKAYRKVFSQFLTFMEETRGKIPDMIHMKDFTRETVSDFLDWLEKENGCTENTRNHRLAVLRSFASFVKYDSPDHLDECLRILSINFKKVEQGEISYLKADGMKLLLEQPDRTTPSGRRDHLMLSLMYSTGIRVSELIGIRVKDISLENPKSLKIFGKGSKVRFVPLIKQVVPFLKAYMKENKLDLPENSNELLFKNHMKAQFTRQGVFFMVRKYASMAREKDSTLIPEGIGCHSLRHSTAMSLVNSKVDLIYVRDLLGHSSVQTTEIYARADSEAKRVAIESAAQDFVPKETAVWENNKSVMDWIRDVTANNIM